MTFTSAAKLVSTIGGAALVAWQLLSQADAALIQHLDAKFATKEDIQRVELKVDQLLTRGHK